MWQKSEGCVTAIPITRLFGDSLAFVQKTKEAESSICGWHVVQDVSLGISNRWWSEDCQ